MEEYNEIITKSMITGHLFGRAYIDDYMGKIKAQYMNEDASTSYFEEVPDSFDVALKFFIAKNIITKDEFEKLNKSVRKYAFTIANVDSQRLLEKLKQSLDEALSEGLSMADWLSGVDNVFKNAGMDRLNDFHLKTVFRTNMQTALNEGKMKIILQADPEEFPLLEFMAIEDARVRSSHLALDGFRAPVNNPVWQQISPPLDFNCRCTLRPVYVGEGLKETKFPKIKNPDHMKFVKDLDKILVKEGITNKASRRVKIKSVKKKLKPAIKKVKYKSAMTKDD